LGAPLRQYREQQFGVCWTSLAGGKNWMMNVLLRPSHYLGLACHSEYGYRNGSFRRKSHLAWAASDLAAKNGSDIVAFGRGRCYLGWQCAWLNATWWKSPMAMVLVNPPMPMPKP